MDCSRRDLALLLPAVAAAQEKTPSKPMLPSKTYRYEDLPVKENGQNKGRAVLNGLTHSNFPVELHLTELGPGQAPHAAAQARSRGDGDAATRHARGHHRGEDHDAHAGVGHLRGLERDARLEKSGHGTGAVLRHRARTGPAVIRRAGTACGGTSRRARASRPAARRCRAPAAPRPCPETGRSAGPGECGRNRG